MSKKRKNKKAKVKKTKVKKTDGIWEVRRATIGERQEAAEDMYAVFSSMCGDWITKLSEHFDTDEDLIDDIKQSIKNLNDKELAEWIHFTDSPTDILEVDDIINEHYSVDGSDDLFRFIKKEMCGSQLILSPEGNYLGVSITTKDDSKNMACSFNSMFGVVFIVNERGLTVVPYRNDKLRNMVYRAFKKIHGIVKSQGLINPPGRMAS